MSADAELSRLTPCRDVRLSTPGQELEGPDHPASTPTKKRAHEQNGDGSQESVEEIDAVLQGERKKKRVRKVRFDRVSSAGAVESGLGLTPSRALRWIRPRSVLPSRTTPSV